LAIIRWRSLKNKYLIWKCFFFQKSLILYGRLGNPLSSTTLLRGKSFYTLTYLLQL
jgi:hypothetical protein